MTNQLNTHYIINEECLRDLKPEEVSKIEGIIKNFIEEQDIPLRAVENNPNTQRRIRRTLSRSLTSDAETGHLIKAVSNSDKSDPIIAKMAADYCCNSDDSEGMEPYLKTIEASEEGNRWTFDILSKRMNFPETINSVDPNVFGPIHETLAETLRDLSPDIASFPHYDELAEILYPHQLDKSVTKEDFRRDLIWGFVSYNFLAYLDRYRNAHKAGTLTGAARNDVLNLCAQLETQQIAPTPETIDFAPQRGQSIVGVVGHSGLPINDSLLLSALMDQTGLPYVQFAQNFRFWDEQVTYKHPVRLLAPTMDISNSELFSILRDLRSKPHVAVVAPDGPFGNHRTWGKLIGYDVHISSGASSFAQLRNSMTVFMGTRWNDDMTREIYLIEGPSYDGTQTRAEFDNAFCAFYLKCMEDIAVGPARDIFARAGVWGQLIKPDTRSPQPQ